MGRHNSYQAITPVKAQLLASHRSWEGTILGEPYIKSKSKEVSLNAGLGLGTFLGKTLLEKKFANLSFSQDKKLGGASVIISWSTNYLKFNV